MSARSNTAWYCVRSQPKREMMALGSLRSLEEVDVFFPRLKRKRAVKGRAVWQVEPLFPGYLFARFDFLTQARAVRFAPGVSTLVHFGEKFVQVPAEAIEELKAFSGEHHVFEVEETLVAGDSVRIVEGPFAGLIATVSRIGSGSERVRVLLEFLGRKSELELARGAVLAEGTHPLAA